jgi:hypothetical protein
MIWFALHHLETLSALLQPALARTIEAAIIQVVTCSV